MKRKSVKISETKRDAYRVSFPIEVILDLDPFENIECKVSGNYYVFEAGRYGCKVRYPEQGYKPFVHYPKKYYSLPVGEYDIVTANSKQVIIQCV